MGILSMMTPVVNGVPVARQTLALWIDPLQQTIARNGEARCTVTVQNQGFEQQRVRVGGPDHAGAGCSLMMWCLILRRMKSGHIP